MSVLGLAVLMAGIALPFVMSMLPETSSPATPAPAPALAVPTTTWPGPDVSAATPTALLTPLPPATSDHAATGLETTSASVRPPTGPPVPTRQPPSDAGAAPRAAPTSATTGRSSVRPSPRPSTSRPTTTDPLSRPGFVHLVDSDYAGGNWEQVRRLLTSQGLVAHDDWQPVPDVVYGTVVGVHPDGWVAVGGDVWIEISRG